MVATLNKTENVMYIFDFWDKEQNEYTFENYKYLQVLISPKEYWDKERVVADWHIWDELPDGILNLVDDLLCESMYSFKVIDGETLSECESRCIKAFKEAGCIYIKVNS